jgi:purine-nucleoside phosphorylase
MSRPYDRALNNLLKEAAQLLAIPLQQGVYAAVNGPNLETRAEYRMLKLLGADIVGMSTVPEVITANHMRLPCAAISVVTDECDPDNLAPIDIGEIIAIAKKADQKLTRLLLSALQIAPVPHIEQT